MTPEPARHGAFPQPFPSAPVIAMTWNCIRLTRVYHWYRNVQHIGWGCHAVIEGHRAMGGESWTTVICVRTSAAMCTALTMPVLHSSRCTSSCHSAACAVSVISCSSYANVSARLGDGMYGTHCSCHPALPSPFFLTIVRLIWVKLFSQGSCWVPLHWHCHAAPC